MTMDIQACPVCDEIDGFHDEAPHMTARGRIPRPLIIPTARQRKAGNDVAERHTALRAAVPELFAWSPR